MPIYQGPNCPDDHYGPAAAAIHVYCQSHAGKRLDRYVLEHDVTIKNVVAANMIIGDALRISITLSGGAEDRDCNLFVTPEYKQIDAPGACSCDA